MAKTEEHKKEEDIEEAHAEAGDEPITAINVTPLVDVCLVLVIIMMVTAPMIMQAGIKVSATSAGSAVGLDTYAESLNINISKDLTVRVQNKLVASKDALNFISGQVNKLRTLKKSHGETNPKITASISADRDVPCWLVVKMLDLCKQSGADNLSMIRKKTQTKVIKEY